MNVTDRFDDTLEPVGIALGVLLVLVGLTTIAGQPWTTKISLPVAIVQVLAALVTAAIGAGLVWLSRADSISLSDD
jgi:hypothetical protein